MSLRLDFLKKLFKSIKQQGSFMQCETREIDWCMVCEWKPNGTVCLDNFEHDVNKKRTCTFHFPFLFSFFFFCKYKTSPYISIALAYRRHKGDTLTHSNFSAE